MDWRDFVEAMSAVEQTLRRDPAKAYAAMDFATRDRYRHVVERVARASRLSEEAVASRAIGLAEEAAARARERRQDGARRVLPDRPRTARSGEGHEGAPSPGAVFRHAAGRAPLLLYLGAITLITVLLGGGLLVEARADVAVGWALAPLAILALLAVASSRSRW